MSDLGKIPPAASGNDFCVLPTFDFGNVNLAAPCETSADCLGGEDCDPSGVCLTTQSLPLSLRNEPIEGCVMPNRPDGSPDCSPVCAVTVDRDPEGRVLGIGVLPDDGPFAFGAATPVPFQIAPAKPECPAAGGLVRGELRLPVRFTARAVPGSANSPGGQPSPS